MIRVARIFIFEKDLIAIASGYGSPDLLGIPRLFTTLDFLGLLTMTGLP